MSQLTSCTPPSKKYQPGGLTILHEDKDILVIDKPSGLLTVGSDHNKSPTTAHYLLNDYVRKGNPKSHQRVYIVHRLDQATSGLIVFAKSESAKTFLQDNWDKTDKHYFAIVHGQMTKKEGMMTTYLIENKANNVYSTANTNAGKLAKTAYIVIQEKKEFSLVDIHLLTGRKHQIRVHFADSGHPVVGDQKYGNDPGNSKRLALHSKSLTFTHPFNKKMMSFVSAMPEDFNRLMGKR
ncbi:MAG: RluA family pseudouridine synthase [Deltaproteobacteria bacterium]|nr:RluA family pseudouridine synthase [Deltaproteobacteria bacterium]